MVMGYSTKAASMTLINNKWEMNLPEHRDQSLQWAYWEIERNAALNKNIRKGDILVDAGSEQGDLPAMFATWGAQVFLIEPNPLFWPTIKQCFEMNDVKPIGYFTGFASDTCLMPEELLEEPFQLQDHDGWPGCAWMDNLQNNDFRNVLERHHDTPQTTIDSLNLDHIDVINMDIEGAEVLALRGAEQTLREDKPLVFVSVHPSFMLKDHGVTQEQLLEWLESLGYEWEILATDHEVHVAAWHTEGRKYIR